MEPRYAVPVRGAVRALEDVPTVSYVHITEPRHQFCPLPFSVRLPGTQGFERYPERSQERSWAQFPSVVKPKSARARAFGAYLRKPGSSKAERPFTAATVIHSKSFQAERPPRRMQGYFLVSREEGKVPPLLSSDELVITGGTSQRVSEAGRDMCLACARRRGIHLKTKQYTDAFDHVAECPEFCRQVGPRVLVGSGGHCPVLAVPTQYSKAVAVQSSIDLRNSNAVAVEQQPDSASRPESLRRPESGGPVMIRVDAPMESSQPAVDDGSTNDKPAPSQHGKEAESSSDDVAGSLRREQRAMETGKVREFGVSERGIYFSVARDDSEKSTDARSRQSSLSASASVSGPRRQSSLSSTLSERTVPRDPTMLEFFDALNPVKVAVNTSLQQSQTVVRQGSEAHERVARAALRLSDVPPKPSVPEQKKPVRHAKRFTLERIDATQPEDFAWSEVSEMRPPNADGPVGLHGFGKQGHKAPSMPGVPAEVRQQDFEHRMKRRQMLVAERERVRMQVELAMEQEAHDAKASRLVKRI